MAWERALPRGVANGSIKAESGRGLKVPTDTDEDALRTASTCWVAIGRKVALGELPGDGEKSLQSVGDKNGLRAPGVEILLGEGDLVPQLSIIGLPKSRA